jgi:subtilase family serine protease
MRPLHKLFLGLIALTSLAATAAVAQHPVSKALIREQVNDNQLTALKGNTPPAANAQNDIGRVSGSMSMTDLILVLHRSPEVQAAFDAFVESQYDPNSPNFHRWLTPEQVGEQFGPALADITTVSSWLSSHGLSVDEVSKDRMTIRFSGSARQVEATFHTELHNLTVAGRTHFSNMSDPQIPMALEPVVLGPKALHNFIPRPLHRTGGKAALNQETGKWQKIAEPGVAGTASVPKANAAFTGARPEIVFSCGTGCLEEDLTPYDFAAIYNLSPLWNAGVDGTGQTIAIAGRSDVKSADVASFRSTFGLTGGSYQQINNGADPGNCTSTASGALCTLDDQIENALDVEWAGATAPKAAVKLVVTQQTNSNDAIYLSAKYAIDNNVAKIINVSYGLCELFMGTSGNASYNQLWQTAETAGISVLVATGDSGSPGCDQGAASQGPYGAQDGLAVSGIASTSHNTAVGGTDLNWDTAATYWNTSSDSHGATAKGYIPEIPWNDTCTNPLEVAYINQTLSTNDSASTICNKIANHLITSSTNEQGVLNLVNTVGAGGGKSNCTTNSTTNATTNPDPSSCSGGYSKPSWQTGVSGIPNDSKRDFPDVSFFAGNGFLNSAYLICVSDWGTCVTSTGTATEPSVGEIGGTSAASPAMAGIMALINQKAGSAQGNPNSGLYALAATQNYGSCKTENVTNSGVCYFNDIDTGTVSMPCAGGSKDCSLTAVSSGNTIGILNGFDATAGFDLATGLGSMNVANVVNGWGASVGTGSATVTVTPTPGTIQSNQTLSVAVTVAGASGTPTGTVSLTGGGYSPAAQTLTSGNVTFNIPANKFAAGTITLTATYSGDSTYASTTGVGAVIVTAAPLPTVTVSPALNAINSGQSLSVPVTVAGGLGTATGNVTLSGGGYTSSAQALASGSVTFTIPANSLSAGSITLTASYAGDSTYGVATGTATVTVTQSTYSLAATTPANVSRGSSATSTVTWTTANNYSSTIKLSSCTLNSGGPTNSSADTPKCTVSTTSFDSTGSGTATVTTSAATTGSLQKPHIGGWAEAGGGAVLALLALFGIPARRRGWRAMVGMLVVLFAIGGLAACGGGGGSSGGGGGGTSDPGTAAGAYTFTVTATGNDSAHTTSTKTFTVTVN